MSDNIRMSDGTEGKPEDLAAFFNMTGTVPVGTKLVTVHPLWIILSVMAYIFLSLILIMADLNKPWLSVFVVLILLDTLGIVIAIHLKWEKKVVSLGTLLGLLVVCGITLQYLKPEDVIKGSVHTAGKALGQDSILMNVNNNGIPNLYNGKPYFRQ